MFLQILEVLVGNHAAHALKVLSRPAELIRFTAGGYDQFIVPQRVAVAKVQRLFSGLHPLHVLPAQVDPVLLPKPRLVGLNILEPLVAHVDVHQRGAREKIIRLRRDQGDLDGGIQFPQPAGGRYAGNPVSDNGYVHGLCLVSG